MPSRDDVLLKVRLQARGVRLEAAREQRAGGAGPTDGVTLFFGGLVATVPTVAPFVSSSPFELVDTGTGGEMLLRDGEPCREVEVAGPPAFYSLETGGGVPFRKIALRHGRDAIGSTVAQYCMRAGDACRFCGIAVSRQSGSTVALKEPGDLAEVGRAALEEGYRHAVLTTGTTDPGDCGIPHLEKCAAALKEATGVAMSVHVQFEPPADMSRIDRIARVSDSAAINIECFDPDALSRVAPGKAAAGVARYESAWRRAVSAFGAGQVCCFILAGLGEDPGSVARGAERLCEMGVYPFLLPFRPTAGTPMVAAAPPAEEMMVELYETVAGLVDASGMSAGDCLAGCVRCGACSAITDW